MNRLCSTVTRRVFGYIAVLVATALSGSAGGEPPPTRISGPQIVIDDVVAAAEHLLAVLTNDQRQRLCFAFDDTTQRDRWSNLPTGLFERRGLRTGDLTEIQRDALTGLLAATLSPRGLQEVLDIVQSDVILHEQSGGGGRHVYGADEFYLALLGTPAAETPWMWQFGGHHLALHATVAEGNITLTPCYTGGNPAHFDDGGRAVAHLGGDLDRVHTLLQSLNDTQRAKTVLDDQPVALAHGPGNPHQHPHTVDDAHAPKGIAGAALDDNQKTALLAVIEDRVGLLHPAFARPTLDAIRDDLDDVHFAWYGPTTANAAGSYRIHGPAVLIEYSPRRLDPDGRVRHSHAVYRNPIRE